MRALFGSQHGGGGLDIVCDSDRRTDNGSFDCQSYLLDLGVEAGVHGHVGCDRRIQKSVRVVAERLLVGKFRERLRRQIAEDMIFGFHRGQRFKNALRVQRVKEVRSAPDGYGNNLILARYDGNGVNPGGNTDFACG